jgi:hypothetical protein
MDSQEECNLQRAYPLAELGDHGYEQEAFVG